MTKGANFQARIDLTNQRREAAKALKAAKAAGLVIEPDALMTKILLLDPDVDVYLLAEPHGGTGAARELGIEQRPLCRAHFQREACSNRRCKWSHALTLGNARPASGGPSGGRNASGEALSYNAEGADESTTEPPLVAMPGFGSRPTDRRRSIGAPRPGSGGGFDALPDGFIDELARWLSCDADLGHWAQSCRVVQIGLAASPHVNSRRTAALPRLTADRNRWLVRKSNAARVKYVVSFAAANAAIEAAALAAHNATSAAAISANSGAPYQSPRSGQEAGVSIEGGDYGGDNGGGGGRGVSAATAAATTATYGKESRRSSRRDKKASSATKAQSCKGTTNALLSSPSASGSSAAAAAAAAASVGPVLAHDWRQLDVFRAFERSHRPSASTSSPISPSARSNSSPGATSVAAPGKGAAAENGGNDEPDALANELDNLSIRSLEGCGEGASGGGGGGGHISRSSSSASEGSSSTGSCSSSAGARACTACTFLDVSEAEGDVCEMCSTPLPPPPPPPLLSSRLSEVRATTSSISNKATAGSTGRIHSVEWTLLELPSAALQRIVALSTDVTAAHVASLSTRHRAAAKADDAFRRRKTEGSERQKKAKKAKKTSRLAKVDKIGRNKMKKGK